MAFERRALAAIRESKQPHRAEQDVRTHFSPLSKDDDGLIGIDLGTKWRRVSAQEDARILTDRDAHGDVVQPHLRASERLGGDVLAEDAR